MNTRTKRFRIGCGIFVGLIVFAVLVLSVVLPKYKQYARRAWKEAALPEISRLANDPIWVSAEIRMLVHEKPDSGQVLAAPWLSEHMILMKNGEWLVYKSHCNKVPPHQVRDIFLARGSNGKWYYSTCHFCVGMCVLLMMQEVQPADIATFARLYHLREFDGVSDECLKETQTSPDFKAIDEANKASEATSEPARGAGSSSPQG